MVLDINRCKAQQEVLEEILWHLVLLHLEDQVQVNNLMIVLQTHHYHSLKDLVLTFRVLVVVEDVANSEGWEQMLLDMDIMAATTAVAAVVPVVLGMILVQRGQDTLVLD